MAKKNPGFKQIEQKSAAEKGVKVRPKAQKPTPPKKASGKKY
jgi:hypothetical protein